MDSDGSNEAVWRENETLMDSDGWKGDTEQQDGFEKETPMDSFFLKRTRRQVDGKGETDGFRRIGQTCDNQKKRLRPLSDFVAPDVVLYHCLLLQCILVLYCIVSLSEIVGRVLRLKVWRDETHVLV